MDKDSNMEEIINETAKIALAVDSVMREYMAVGGNPGMIPVALCAEGGRLMAEQGSPEAARELLIAIGNGLVTHAKPATRPASSAEMLTVTRTAIATITGEFLKVCNGAAQMIEGGESIKARNVLLEYIAKLNTGKPTIN